MTFQYNEGAFFAQHYDDEWLRNELGLWTYKPGWRFELITSPTPAWSLLGKSYLRITAKVEDTYNPGVMIDIGGQFPLWTEGRDEMHFGRSLQAAVFDAEQHESREHLKRNGIIWDNPHNPRK